MLLPCLHHGQSLVVHKNQIFCWFWLCSIHRKKTKGLIYNMIYDITIHDYGMLWLWLLFIYRKKTTKPGDSIVALFSGKPLVGYTFCHPWVFFEGLRTFWGFQWIWALFGVQTHFTPSYLCWHASAVWAPKRWFRAVGPWEYWRVPWRHVQTFRIFVQNCGC